MGRITDAPSTQWRLRSQQADGWREICDAHDLSALAARMLARRGIAGPEEAERFLNPRLSRMHDPATMADMGKAVGAAVEALETEAPIFIHGDYDVDGLTSTALLYEFFDHVGAQVDYFIPHRIDDGYGLDEDRIRRVARNGCGLMITADCGVTAVDEIEMARELGMDVVVVDHHSVPDEMPEANAVLNPQRPDCDFPFDGLSAAGVTFNYIVALRRGLRKEGGFGGKGEPELKRALELVALGTVADVVPLVDENRTFVRRGLQLMSECPRPGVEALLEVSGADEGPVTTQTIGFKLAPRMNAAGRIADASSCVDLLTTRSPRRARKIARSLNDLNEERRELQSEVLEEALSEAKRQDADDEQMIEIGRAHV